MEVVRGARDERRAEGANVYFGREPRDTGDASRHCHASPGFEQVERVCENSIAKHSGLHYRYQVAPGRFTWQR